MTVKKVNPGDELQSDVVNMLNAGKTRRSRKGTGLEGLLGEDPSAEKIDVALGSAINSELNAEQIMLERKEKVERLKKLVQSGQYQPPTLEVAQAVGEELVMEILSNPKDSSDYFESEE